MRVNAVGKLMEEMNKPVAPRRSISKSNAVDETEQVKSRRFLGRDKYEHSRRKGHGTETCNTPKLQKIKTKACEAKNGMLIKDIPLDQVTSSSLKGIRKKGSGRVDDQMLELWETAEDLTIGESLRRSFKITDKDIVYDEFENVRRLSDPPFTDSDVEKELRVDKWEVSRSSSSSELNREMSGRRVLERLASDAQKLESLQMTVLNLRGKLETNRKGYRKVKNVDLETVQEQLVEAEETVASLVDLNGRLVRSIEECHSPDRKKEGVKTRRRKVAEQARKGSERIGRLQLELQKIQYMLLKMEDEKKRNKFLKSKTVILRDFIIYNGRKSSGRRKKGPLCGCFRPSGSRNGSSP
ncbi:protein NETWORKED 1A-like [Salvia hispanica]|nr:protein NETWORKED 1A-like [Salvia hispanica]